MILPRMQEATGLPMFTDAGLPMICEETEPCCGDCDLVVDFHWLQTGARSYEFFDDSTSRAEIVRQDWLFGDGGGGSGSPFTYTYPDAGDTITYPVTLEVEDADGCIGRLTKVLEVELAGCNGCAREVGGMPLEVIGMLGDSPEQCGHFLGEPFIMRGSGSCTWGFINPPSFPPGNTCVCVGPRLTVGAAFVNGRPHVQLSMTFDCVSVGGSQGGGPPANWRWYALIPANTNPPDCAAIIRGGATLRSDPPGFLADMVIGA